MKKKISILTHSLSGGGAERVVSILVNELSPNYDVHLFLMNSKIEYSIPKNTKIYFLEKNNNFENKIFKILKLPYLALKYKKKCIKLNIQISISFLYRPNFINILAHKTLIKSKIKVVISERSNILMQSIIIKTLVKVLYPLAETIIPNSKGSANILIKKFNIPKTKIQVINNPNSIITNNLNTNKNKIFTFITVGRLNKLKNQESLLYAFSKIKSNLEFQLLILGNGQEDVYLKQLSKKLQIDNKIQFLGFKKNVFEYLLNSNVFVFTSTHEGFPNVLLEALKAKLPIISTDCLFGPREILAPDNFNSTLKNGIEIAKYGILIPVNAIEELSYSMSLLLNDNNLLEKYKNTAIERSNDFEIEKIIPKFTNIIDN